MAIELGSNIPETVTVSKEGFALLLALAQLEGNAGIQHLMDEHILRHDIPDRITEECHTVLQTHSQEFDEAYHANAIGIIRFFIDEGKLFVDYSSDDEDGQIEIISA